MTSKYKNIKRHSRLLVDQALNAVKAGFSSDAQHLRPVALTQLEQRILMSASPMAVVADAVEAPAQEVAPIDAPESNSVSSSDNSVQPNAAAAQASIELVVIDPSADNHQQMVADLESQTERTFEILILNPLEDGIQQITEALKNLRDVSAIHLVSHGDEGEILLGTSVLSQRSITRYAAEIVTWQYSMTADADLLIYGCDLTASNSGIELTESLNTLLGADVAASNDATGQATQGGDWDLEQQVGQIETSVAFTAELQRNWQGLLAVAATGELPVNTTTTDVQETSGEDRGSQQAVSVAADGSYVVAWSSVNQDGSGWGIVARRFDSNGVAITPEIQVNETTSDNQRWAGVASDASGNFVVTWTSTSQDGTPQSVYARWFNSNGSAPAGEFRVNTTNSGTQKDSSIAMNSAGDFIIAWQGEGPGDTGGIFYRRFAANQTALDGADVLANASDGGTEEDPDVAINDAGQFAITWSEGSDAYVRHFAADGSPATADIQVDSNIANGFAPTVGIDATGRTTVVYRTDGTLGGLGRGVWGRSFEANGDERTSSFQVAGSNATAPSLDMDAAGNFVVVWENSGDSDGKGVYARRYNADGDAQSDAVLVNATTQSGDQEMASVGLLDFNNFVIVWSGEGTGDSDGVFRRQIHVEAPVLDLDANNSSGASGANFRANFEHGGGPISIVDSDATITDGNNSNLESLTVRITNRQDGSDEVLAADVSGTNISASYSGFTGTLTLSGTDTVANYQTVLRSLTYENSQNPATGTSRTITFVVNDGMANSNVATTTVSIPAVTSATFAAVADTRISNGSRSSNHGASDSLIVNKGGGGIGNDRALLRFDLSGIPAGATIVDATLELTATDVQNNFDINVYELTEAWDEGAGDGGNDAANWDKRTDSLDWTDSGGTFDSTIIDTFNAQNTGTHSWDLTSLVAAWADGSKANNGVILGSTDTGSDTVTYDSREGDTPPRLVVTYALANSSPTADAGGPYTINEGSSVNLDASGSSDSDGNTLTYNWDLDNDGNFLESGEPTGVNSTVTWATLQAFGIDSLGTHTIGLQVDDGNGGVTAATTTLTITSSPPVAVNDTSTTPRDSAVIINLTGNDTDSLGDGLTVLDVATPGSGTVVNNQDGTVTFTPANGFSGSVSFDYVIGDQSDGLTHFYNLNGNAVDVVGGADGTLRNGVSVVAGANGEALAFDEIDDYVELPDIAYNNEFTVSFKFRVDDNVGSNYQYLYSHGDGATVNSLNIILGEDSRPGFAGTLKTIFGDNNDTYDLNALNFDASAVVGDGNWHTYTLTVDAVNGASVYLDGVLRASDANRGGNAFNPNGNIFLGAKNDLDAERFFGGGLDSVAVFDRSLNSGEVTALNAATLTTNSTSTATVTVSVVNGAPTANAGSAYQIAEGGTLALNGSGSTDPNNDTLTYEWDLNYDGATFTSDVTGVAPSVNWATLQSSGITDNGTYQIALRVNDGLGYSSIVQQTLTVTNAAPTLSVTGNSSASSGLTYSLNLAATDPGNDTISSWTINWGDGAIQTVTGNPGTVTHVYTNNGFTNNILVSATDEDGTYTSSQLYVSSAATSELFRIDANNGQTLSQTTVLTTPIGVIIGPDGLLYSTNFSTFDIDRYDPVSGDYIDTFVHSNSAGLTQPSRLAFGPDGNLYVSSQGSNEILRYGGDGRFLGRFVTAGSGGLDQPDGLAFGPDGNLYVVSRATGDILIFDGDSGAPIGTFASFGQTTYSQLSFRNNGNLLASSTANNVIREFDPLGNVVADIVTAASGITSAGGFSFGPDGRLYVADFGGGRVMQYEADGTFIGEFVAAADGLNQPIGLTFTPALQVYVNSAATVSGESYSLAEGGTLTENTVNNWFNASWKQRQQITINNSAVTANLNDFPVLVKLHASASDAINIDYSATQDFGQDLRFVNADGTMLQYEVESWDESGYSYVWVNVPQVNATAATNSFWMYYDNSRATDGHESDDVWDSHFGAVLHLNRYTIDSSSNSNNGAITNVSPTAGIIAGAGAFNGSDSQLNLGSATSVDDVFSGGGTVSAFINPQGWGEGGFGRIADKASTTFSGTTNGDGWAFQVGGSGTSGYLLFEHGFTGGVGEWRTAAGTLNLNTWQHVAVVYDNSSANNNPQIYINGVLQVLSEDRTPSGTARSDAALNLMVGNHSVASSRTFFGAIDEFRISTSSATAGELATYYANITGNLLASTGVETGPGGVLTNDFDTDGDALTVTLVTGPTNHASFSLNPDGSFSYVHNDSETTSDSFTYTVSDGLTTSGPVTVSLAISAVNDNTPEIAAGLTFTVSDAAPVGTSVGTATATDTDAGTTFANWTINSGNAAGVFAINSASGEITIANTTNLNYNTSNSYTLGLTVSDGTNTSSVRTVTVNVTDANNSAPEITAGQSFSVSEAAGNGTSLGILTATDGDSATTFSNWTITNGNDDGAFALDAATGQLSIADSSRLDFETTAARAISVTVSDGTNTSASRTVSIAVTDFDEFDVGPVTDTNTTVNSVPENSATGTTVGLTASAIDEDGSNNTITYSLVNNAGGRFAISASTGAVTVANGSRLDYESRTSHSITVRATSADGSFQTQNFTIAVEDVNEFAIGSISDTDGTTNAVAENSAVGTVVGITAFATDTDATDTVTYSLSVSSGSLFAIDAATGVITTNAVLDRETTDTHSVTVIATSTDGSTASQLFNIAVLDQNDNAPVVTPGQSFDVSEFAGNGVVVGIVAATDADANTVASNWTITSGNPDGVFAINASTGRITVANNATLDFETSPAYTLTVQIDDGVNGAIAGTILINVVNQDDSPTITSIADVVSVEDTAIGPIAFSIEDVDSSLTLLTVTATSGDQNLIRDTDITITGTGTNRFISLTPVANANGGPATISVRVSDGTTTTTETFTVTVTAVNDAPEISNIPNVTTDEDTSVGPFTFNIADVETPTSALIVTATSSDQSLVRDADIILSGTGASRTLSLTPSANANGGPATITVSVSDGTTTTTDTFEVSVTSVEDAPTISNIPNVTIAEDSSVGAFTFNVVDAETAPDALIVTATSSDQSLVRDADIILSGTGTSRTISLTPVANANGGPALITVSVSDGTSTTTETFTVNVTAVNDTPTISNIPNVTIAEDSSTGTFTFSIADVETAADALIVTATSSDQSIIADAGIILGGTAANRTISVTPVPNANGAATITVNVWDGTTSVERTFTVTITPTNDAPTITPIPNVTIPEDTTVGPFAFTVGDVDHSTASLTVTATSDDQSVIADSDIIISGSGANRTITVTPVANASGSATISVSVSDGSITTTETLEVTVTAVNDAPTMSVIPNVTTDEDTAIGPFTFTISDVESDATDLTITATSSNQDILRNNRIVLGGTGTNRTISVNPNADAFGTVDVTLTISDGETSSQQTFRLTVNPVNDAPTVSNIASMTIDEDTSSGPIAVTVSDVDNLNSTLVVTVTSSNQSLIANGDIRVAGSGINRNISFQPRKDAFGGPVTMMVSVTDGQLVTQTSFVVNVTPVNDAPAFAPDATFSFLVKDDYVLQSDAPGLLRGVTDAEGDSFTAVLVSGPSHGSLNLRQDGSFTYIADVGYAGLDTFEFYVTDGKTNGNTTTVQMRVPLVVPLPAATINASTQTETTPKANVVVETTPTLDVEPAQEQAQLAPPAETPPATHTEPESESEDDEYIPLVTAQNEDDDTDEHGFTLNTSEDPSNDFAFMSTGSIGTIEANRVETSELNSHGNFSSAINSLSVPAGVDSTMAIFTTASYEDFADVKGAIEQVEHLRDTLDTRIDMSKVAVNTVAATGMTVFVGSVFTAIRTGVLALGFLTQLPVWTMFDPLMVMDGASGEEGDSLEEIIDRNAKAAEERAKLETRT